MREVLGGVVTAFQAPIGVGGDEGQRVDRRSRHGLADELGSERGEGAQATLLPGSDEQPSAVVIRDGGAGVREGKPTSAAFLATCYRPGGGRSAPIAPRGAESRQPGAA